MTFDHLAFVRTQLEGDTCDLPVVTVVIQIKPRNHADGVKFWLLRLGMDLVIGADKVGSSWSCGEEKA